MELVKIENKELQVKEWNNERILTVWDIAELHKKRINKINELLIKHLIKNVDYYSLSRDEFSVSQIYIQKKIPNNVKFIYLLKADGYLKLIRCFNELNLSLGNVNKVYRSLGGKKDISILAPNTRFEISFKNVLFEALKELSINVEHQIYIDNYRLDFYIFEFNLVIEYDEDYHKYNKEKDKIREKEIKEKLGNDCKFLRLDYRDSDIKNLMKVLKVP